MLSARPKGYLSTNHPQFLRIIDDVARCSHRKGKIRIPSIHHIEAPFVIWKRTFGERKREFCALSLIWKQAAFEDLKMTAFVPHYLLGLCVMANA